MKGAITVHKPANIDQRIRLLEIIGGLRVEIDNATDVDRTNRSGKALAGSRVAGFDINEDAIIIDKILSGED